MKISEHPLRWLFSKTAKPLFTQAMVLEMAPNVSAATLQNWANRGLVESVMKGGEVRGRRFYDATQLASVVIGSKLMDSFQIPPAFAVLSVAAANASVLPRWVSDAVVGTTRDAEKMPIKIEWLSQYWAIQSGDNGKVSAVRQTELLKFVRENGASLLWPHGQEMIDLARISREIYERSEISQ